MSNIQPISSKIGPKWGGKNGKEMPQFPHSSWSVSSVVDRPSMSKNFTCEHGTACDLDLLGKNSRPKPCLMEDDDSTGTACQP